MKVIKKSIIFLCLVFAFITGLVAQPTPNTGAKLPDNIKLDVDCFTDPPAINFTFKELMRSPKAYPVNYYNTPVCGDIDNDGYIEIIIPKLRSQRYGISEKDLQIFKVKNNKLEHQQTLSTPVMEIVANPFAIAKVDNTGYASIFICSGETYSLSETDKRKLIKYVYNPQTKLFEEFMVNGNVKRGTYSDYPTKEMAQPMIVDFNGDGIPEVVTYDRIYNAQTMELIADGGYLGQALVYNGTAMGFGFGGHINNNQRQEASSIMAVADMDNDGVPEVIGGNCVYKVNITNPNGTNGNSFKLWKKCSQKDINNGQHNEAVDGATAIADIDGDGYLDVIVTTGRGRNPSGYGALYVWNPFTDKILHTNIIDGFRLENNGNYGISVAFIGDIDNSDEKNIPEICLTAALKIYAFQYNLTQKTLTQKWAKNTSDKSGATTLSLFDFDQDTNAELVYRDETQLRILNGKDGTNKIQPIACSSPTGIEYPIIADVNNDGSAEIIVAGDEYLRIFASNPVGAWAPARKVWNQFAYNVVNVNDDLTIPKVQFRQTIKFAGKDGILGNSNDIRPYNNYLQQQTSLNKNGTQLWLAGNAKFSSLPKYEYDKATDKMKITLVITNVGGNPFRNPFYVTVYKDKITNTLKKYTYAYADLIPPNKTATFSFTLDRFTSDWNPNNGIIINLNDNGDGTQDQNVCGQTAPIYYYPVIPTSQDDCADMIDKTLTCPYAPEGSKFQWELSKNGGSIWSDINGATDRIYNIKQMRGKILYRVKVTLPESVEKTSDAVTVRMRSCQIPVNHNISVMEYELGE